MLFASRVLLASALACGLATAEDKPNFSGTWKLDVSHSVQLPRRLTGLTIVIEHADPRLKMKYTYYRGDTAEELADDGEVSCKEGVTRRGDRITRASMCWDGASLHSKAIITEGGTTATSDDKFTLSQGGQVLTIYEHFTEPGNERRREFVLRKQ